MRSEGNRNFRQGKTKYLAEKAFTAAAIIFTTLLQLGAPMAAPAQKADGRSAPLKMTASTNRKAAGDVVATANRLFGTNGGESVNTPMSGPSAEGEKYMFANVEFTNRAAREQVFTSAKVSKLADVSVLTTVDKFADVFIKSEEAFDALSKLPGVVYIDGVRDVTLPPPPEGTSKPSPSKSVAEQIVRGGYLSYKGKNVIIAIVDTGVDFRHQDFITYDAAGKPTSRLLYLWDTGLEYKKGRGNQAGFKYPNGASVGTVFTRDQLTAELRGTTTTIPANDLDGHGTACASIAAGNGNADMGATGLKRPEVVGVAPEADIIGVSLDSMKDGSLGGAYLVNAINDWLDTVAGARPLVVSNSWGGHYTAYDGQTVSEREMNARYPLSKKSRAILFAAGNEGELKFHGTATFGGASNVAAIPYTAASDQMRIYFDSSDLDDIVVQAGNGTSASISWSAINPLTKQAYLYLQMGTGSGSIYLSTKSGKTIKANMYLAASRDSAFGVPVLNNNGLVGTPGTMENAITVGSYDWNDNYNMQGANYVMYGACSTPKSVISIGTISCYSSPGPTRDGRRKPEITSPGQWYTSSRARVSGNPIKPKYADTTGFYTLMNGTSAATPYTAGIVALMFNKQPMLSLGEIKTLLQSNASKTPATGMTPGPAWGAGKLDMTAVQKIFDAIK